MKKTRYQEIETLLKEKIQHCILIPFSCRNQQKGNGIQQLYFNRQKMN